MQDGFFICEFASRPSRNPHLQACAICYDFRSLYGFLYRIHASRMAGGCYFRHVLWRPLAEYINLRTCFTSSDTPACSSLQPILSNSRAFKKPRTASTVRGLAILMRLRRRTYKIVNCKSLPSHSAPVAEREPAWLRGETCGNRKFGIRNLEKGVPPTPCGLRRDADWYAMIGANERGW